MTGSSAACVRRQTSQPSLSSLQRCHLLPSGRVSAWDFRQISGSSYSAENALNLLADKPDRLHVA